MSWVDFILGNEKAFDAIYREHVDDLYSYGIKYHSDKEMVLDCIHDLFVSLFNNPKIAKDVQVKFYLFSSLRRRLLRAKTAQHHVEITQLNEDVLGVSSPELEWIKREKEEVNIKRVKKQIDGLPKRQREVLFLKYYMDFSYEEIASIMDVSVESCRTLSYRAIKQLKTELQPVEFLLILSLGFLF